MSALSPKFIGLLVTVLMVVSGITAAALVIFSGEEAEVEAAQSSKRDSSGYIWVDNQDPDPKIEYEWIDGTQGEYLPGVKSTMSQNTNVKYKLPFQFEFYGQYFDEVMVHAAGYLDFAPYYDYYYGYYGIPYSGYWNGFIAVNCGYNGAYYYYPGGNFKVFALEGRTFGERWVCFQWDRSYCYYFASYYENEEDEITYQCIIYESGLIKMQYKDMTSTGNYARYSNGYYGLTGIENHQGTDGLQYNGWYDAKLKDGLAIMFGKNLMEVSSAELDSDEGGALYAMHRDYMITATVSHPLGVDNVKLVAASFGNNYGSLVMYYFPDGSYAFSTDDPEGILTINTARSYAVVDGEELLVVFYFSPTFAYPTTSIQNLKVTALGVGALPKTYLMESAYWVEKYLDVYGSLAAFSKERGFIQNGGWVHGNEEFQFQGVKAVYPGTVKSPMPGAITFLATDEYGNEFVQSFVEEYCAIDMVSENDFTRKTYNISIGNIPPGSDISEGITYYINIDPFRPLPPEDIKIRADSFDDNNILYDDDNEVYVTWSPAEDLESGISGYYVSTTDPNVEAETRSGQTTWVESPDTSTKIIFDSAGTRKVWVYSVDKAGNPSIPAFAVTKVDAEEVTFSEFSPGHQIWVNTHTPINSILIDDGDGSGVSAKNVQYSVSTTTTDEYSAWATVKVARDAAQVRASVQSTFVNGKTNWIRYRATDVAGNGWTYSQDFNVWVDEEAPIFVNFRPYESEFQNGRSVVVSLDITDKHSAREGSGIKTDTIEFRYSTGGKGLYGDWKSAVITSQTDQAVHIEMEVEFEEGKDNYVQFRTYDNVGNYAQSKDFNVKVNTAPEIVATVSEPMFSKEEYLTEERILFDASDSKDPDGDDLDYMWYSDINGFLSNSESFFRSLSAGFHEITLIANDPAHTVVVKFDLVVVEEEQIDPESIDSDGDGMHDAWEIYYKLNPFRPDGYIDTDHDMFTNYQEYQNRTDPTLSSKHPPRPPGDDFRDVEEDKDTDEQYRVVTLAVLLLSLVIIIALILLAISKRRNFQMEVEEEKDLEAEELDYRQTLERKKAERLSMEK